MAAEGNLGPILCAAAFMTAIQDHDAARLQHLVTPESLPTWLTHMDSVRETVLAYPSLTSRPEYLTQNVAYVKIVPDPGVSMFATQEILLPDAQLLTLQYRPRLPDPEGRGAWRVHSIGDIHWPLDEMPTTKHDAQFT